MNLIYLLKKRTKATSITMFIILSIISVSLLFLMFTLHGFTELFLHIHIIQFSFSIFLFLCIIAPIMLIKNANHKKLQKNKYGWKIIILFGLLVPSYFISINTFAPYVRFEDKQPMLLMSESTGIYGISNVGVCFWTKDSTINRIEWGIEDSTEIKSLNEPYYSNEHCFMLRDLYPNTKYWYMINNEQTYNFTTPSINGTLRFACAGDLHFGKSDMQKDAITHMLSTIQKSNTDMFFGLGDWVDSGYNDNQWQMCFDTISPYLSNMFTGAIIGNHDAMFGGYKMYADYFNPIGMDKTNGNEFWKHIVIGNVHFFLLQLEWGIESFSEEQNAWLDIELKSVPNDDWKIILTHAPLFTSSGGKLFYIQTNDIQSNVNKLLPIFEQNGVDMVLSGHSHRMEKKKKNGIFYGIAGSFGSNDWGVNIDDDTKPIWYQDDTFGYMDISINGDNGLIVFRDDENTNLFSYNVTST